jgi:hypothetical protein
VAIPQPKTVNDLILKAFLLANEYAPSEQPTSAEIHEALDYLNEMLDSFATDDFYIPYNNDIEFYTIGGKATYSFGQLATSDVKTNKFIDINDAYVKYQGINYPLMEIQHDEAFQIVRYPQAQTRPTQLFLQNTNDESQITLFCTPDTVYDIVLRAKQIFNNIQLFTEITNVPKHYMRFLRYALARELCLVFETNSWNDIKESEYQKLLSEIKSVSDTDWSLNVSTVLRRRYIGLTKGNIMAG